MTTVFAPQPCVVELRLELLLPCGVFGPPPRFFAISPEYPHAANGPWQNLMQSADSLTKTKSRQNVTGFVPNFSSLLEFGHLSQIDDLVGQPRGLRRRLTPPQCRTSARRRRAAPRVR